MKEYLDSFNKGFCYEEGFGPSKIKPFIQRKRFIDTRAIVGETISLETKEIFGEGRESSPASLLFLFSFLT